jgi:hypothetical protein
VPSAVFGPEGPLSCDFRALRHGYITPPGKASGDLWAAQELAVLPALLPLAPAGRGGPVRAAEGKSSREARGGPSAVTLYRARPLMAREGL